MAAQKPDLSQGATDPRWWDKRTPVVLSRSWRSSACCRRSLSPLVDSWGWPRVCGWPTRKFDSSHHSRPCRRSRPRPLHGRDHRCFEERWGACSASPGLPRERRRSGWREPKRQASFRPPGLGSSWLPRSACGCQQPRSSRPLPAGRPSSSRRAWARRLLQWEGDGTSSKRIALV